MPAHIKLSSMDADRPTQPLVEDSDDDFLDNIEENVDDWDPKGKRPAWLSSSPNKKRGSLGGLRSLSLTQYLLIACTVSFLLAAGFLSHSRNSKNSSSLEEDGKSQVIDDDNNQDDPDPDYVSKFLNRTRTSHPIDKLMDDALAHHNAQLSQRSHDLSTAAARYRDRRGRHPPPGFDAWFRYASDNSAVVVESFFDRIYSDLSPFWGDASQPPRDLARRAASWHHIMRVRNGTAFSVGKQEIWLDHWTNLVKECAEFLPDLDMPINFMDESRLLVPYEKIANYTANELSSRSIPPPDKVISTFTPLSESVDDSLLPYDPEGKSWPKESYANPAIFHGEGSFWEYTRQTCPPDSPSRNIPALNATELEFSPPEALLLSSSSSSSSSPSGGWNPDFQFRGFVANMSAARDPCTQPHLRGMHASFIEPISMSVTQDLVPLFGGSKLTRNNEILLPGAMYLTDDPYYSGGDGYDNQLAWYEKADGAVWRGVASGGRHKKENWRRFQRMRLVEMMNGTTISAVEEEGEGSRERRRPETFAMPQNGTWGGEDDDDDDEGFFGYENFGRRHDGKVGEWLNSKVSVPPQAAAAAAVEKIQSSEKEEEEEQQKEQISFSDAGFIYLGCFPAESKCDYLNQHMRKVPALTMEEMYTRKLLPDVDGNSFSGRFRGFLRSTSLPIKATVYAEWHDDRLTPWLHYVPLDNTLRDLYPVLDFFSSSSSSSREEEEEEDGAGDRAGRWIAERGMEWSGEVLRREDMLLYVWRLLLEWARVCDERRERLGWVGDLVDGEGEEEEEVRN